MLEEGTTLLSCKKDRTKRKVFIPNKSIHDFSPAECYGELVFLSVGNIGSFSVTSAYRRFYDAMKDSSPEDYVLLSGLTMLNVVATLIMERLHGRVNILLFKASKGGRKEYLERVIG